MLAANHDVDDAVEQHGVIGSAAAWQAVDDTRE